MPKSVKVTGIKAKDKTYDGNDTAILTTANASFAGKLKGDSLKVEASGSYQSTGEEEASDVLMDSKSVVSAKNITIDTLNLIAGDDSTLVGNYVIADASYEETASAKILPKSITIKKGLKAKDKVYNASTVAEIDFSEVVFNGVVGSDSNTLKELLSGDESKHIAYTADYVSKDVAYDKPENGDKVVAEKSANANDYYFVIDETTPQIMKNYVIASEGNQVELKGKITPKPVTVTGLVAKDKTYDGTAKAEIDASDVTFTGKFKGDLLAVEISGNYQATGEEKTSDVILDDRGAATDKKVVVDSIKLVAGDETTIVDNYMLADDSKADAIKLQAKILPKSITVKEGLKANDKVYDASTSTTIDFSDVVFDGTVGEDATELKNLVNGEEIKHVTYKAEFASKDVATDISVSATDYAFVLDGTTPQIMKNYVIAANDNQTELKGKITPKAVKVSGIKANDKTYDGTDEVELDLNDITFDGIIGEDKLMVTVKGAFVKTEEEKPEDVLYTAEGEVGKKKVTLIISDLESGDETTNVGNYYLEEEGQQAETEAFINPIAVTPKKWSIDEKTQLPVIVIDEEDNKNASVDENAETVVNYYEEDDTKFTTPIDVDKLVAGKKYVARIEGYSNSNYQVADEFKAVTYTFTYSKEDEKDKTKDKQDDKNKTTTENNKDTKTEATPTTEALPTDDVKADAALNLDSDLLVTVKGDKLTFKWGIASEADGYNVYTSTKKGKYGEPVKVMGVNLHTYKITNQKKYYYMYVEAFKIVNGEETVLAKSKELVWAGSKTKGVNAKVVKVSKKKLTVGVKKKVALKASIVVSKKVGKVNRTQTIKGKKAGLTYWSTDKKVATVSSKGKIKGVKAGTCYIYVMAKDGKKQKVKVTVK